MKIEQLEFLIEVVKAGSINAASKKIFISQQSGWLSETVCDC